ncbi:MAG: DUF4367 domain-containing protein [Clostridia bacterium]|nr:DUF4367 domain-containing protein [Clostridia bacterium]
MDDKRFEELLGKAFEIEQYNEISKEPTADELSKAAPFTEKQLRQVQSICKRNRRLPWLKYSGRVASIVLCVCLAGFCGMMLNPKIRATVSENIVKLVDEYINIDFSESTKEENIDIAKTVIGYIPEGFELREDLSDDEKLSCIYVDGNENYLFIDVVQSGEVFISYERDEHNVTYMNINGYDGYLSYDEMTAQGSVCWGNSNFTVVISGFTSRDELIKIAVNIKTIK